MLGGKLSKNGTVVVKNEIDFAIVFCAYVSVFLIFSYLLFRFYFLYRTYIHTFFIKDAKLQKHTIKKASRKGTYEVNPM